MGLVVSLYQKVTSAFTTPSRHQQTYDELTALRHRDCCRSAISDFQICMIDIKETERMRDRNFFSGSNLISSGARKIFVQTRCERAPKELTDLLKAKDELFVAFAESGNDLEDVKSSVEEYINHVFVKNYFLNVSLIQCIEQYDQYSPELALLIENDASIERFQEDLPDLQMRFNTWFNRESDEDVKLTVKNFMDFLDVRLNEQLPKNEGQQLRA